MSIVWKGTALDALRFARGGIGLAHRSEDPLRFCRADRCCKEWEAPDDYRSDRVGRELGAGRARISLGVGHLEQCAS